MTELGKVASNACLVHTWNYLWMHHVWSLCGIMGQVNQLFCIDQGGGVHILQLYEEAQSFLHYLFLPHLTWV